MCLTVRLLTNTQQLVLITYKGEPIMPAINEHNRYAKALSIIAKGNYVI